MIRALVFDFDGLLVDTETPRWRAISQIFDDHGARLELAPWQDIVGTLGGFDAHTRLEAATGRPVDRDELMSRYRQRARALIDEELAMPGVLDYLAGATRRGLGVAVASSGSTQWVTEHLERLGLSHHFDAVCCADGDPDRAKPAPTVFEEAVAALGIAPDEGVALEDSLHGVVAAKRAGLHCVAVPNRITDGLDFAAADLVVDSLDAFPLADLLDHFGG